MSSSSSSFQYSSSSSSLDSSSSSSLDSSSSTSLGYSSSSSSSSDGYSESSSSSGYCQYPSCEGSVCAHLSGWYLENAKLDVVIDEVLYVKTVFFPATNTQQVEIYLDQTYFQLVAIGQVTSVVATPITLDERSGSGITGTVGWDATPLDYSYSGILYCTDRSSSSSSSSIDSSSESSETSQSFSSSSSQCCTTVFCEGPNCAYFTNWVLSGMGDGNTTNCTLFIGLETSGSIQQVRLYKEPELINLVAVGQRTGAGSITLIEQNDSGLTGTVSYDGTLLPHPNVLAIGCNEFSSSSSDSSSSIDSSSSTSEGQTTTSDSFSTSSSTSSIDSSSSSSSEDYSVSSGSSQSISSSSSLTSASESSSSSIDSSSTSSESFGNVSTSSSSSGLFWNQAKPLILGITSPANPNIKNRIAQSFKVLETEYDIGKVYCYIYEAIGISTDYDIRVSIWDCFDDGSPKTELFIKSIPASSVVRSDWYAFEFDLSEETTPSNQYLAISMRHDGDDDNYVLWGYDAKNPDAETIAWTSNNAVDWDEYENSIMAMRIVGNFDPIDTIGGALVTPPSVGPVVITDPLIDEQIDYSDAILSFVVDSSGSMGTTDRFNNRQGIAGCLIDSFKATYPSDILFDVHTFGGGEINVGGITGGIGRYATINLDLNTPSRTTYVFTVSGSDAKIDDVYENDGNFFTVTHRLLSDQTLLITKGEEDPIDSGTLNLISGTGDAVIPYGAVKKSTINDPLVAFGFKDLEPLHTYNVGEFKVDNEIITPVEINNWQLFFTENETPSLNLGLDGPGDTASIDIKASTNLTSRKLFTNADIYQSPMNSILYVGGNEVTATDASGFSVGGYIDILEGGSANMSRLITEIDGNAITFEPEATQGITNNIRAGSIIQTSTYNRTKSINGTTANLLVRDINRSRDVVFYLQTSEGYHMEWDLEAFREWVSFNIFFFGETAILPMAFFEQDGTAFPNGTQVDLVVDKEPALLTANKIASTEVIQTSSAGQTKVYVASTEGYYRGLVIDITDKNGEVQTVKIEEIGEDGGGPYIELADPLLFEVSTTNGTVIKPNTTVEEKATPSNNILSTEIPIVDVTPVVNDEDLDSSLLKPYDIARVPSSTPYEDLNTAPEYFQKEIIDMPTVSGNVCARVLPIVEDILETVAEKEEDLNRLQRYSATSEIVSQLEQNEGDEETATDLPTVEDEVVEDDSEIDYVIQTPVFTNDGFAVSSMQSFAQSYTEKSFEGITIPGIESPIFYSKDYEIYSSADFLGEEGRTLARLYIEPFSVSFITPITMGNIYTEEDDFIGANEFGTPYYLKDPSGEVCVAPYDKRYVRGHYASQDTTITLEYTVADKFILANDKFINIKIYSNRIVSLDGVAQDIVFGENENSSPKPVSEQFSNIRPFNSSTTNTDGETVSNSKTDIDRWRDIVTNNPFEEVIDSINETDSALDPVTAPAENTSVSDNIIEQYAGLLNAALDDGPEADNTSLFYQDPAQWTLAKQFAQYEFQIPIVNGKASVTIPKTDIVSLLFVEASVAFGNDNEHEQILGDMFLISNPVSISGISPSAISPVENEQYEIGANIKFFDGAEVIDDNTQVNFSFTNTEEQFRVEPSTSVTDNGWAGGIFIGPISPIEPEEPNPAAEERCPPTVDLTAHVEVFHSSGYIRRSSFNITLVGQSEEGEDGGAFLFLGYDATTALPADGTVNPDAKITMDLDDTVNPTIVSSPGDFRTWVGEDGVERLQGFDQPNDLPRTVTAFNATPRRSTWANRGKVDLVALPLNENIGFAPPLGEGERFENPWTVEVRAVTSYRYENGAFARGQMASGLPFIAGLLGGIEVPRPIITYVEPLGITAYLEEALIRDGVSSPVVVADVTWNGSPITNKFTLNVGTEFESTIDYPFPKITFESGTCEEENSSEGENPRAIDFRNVQSGCYKVAPDDNAVLTDYSVTAGLLRSNTHDDESGNIHTHSTVIDDDGNGTTTSTIVISGTVADHTHTYASYSSDTALGHSHTLRCVALTAFLPTTNVDTDYVVNAKVIYDPTNCEPYKNEPQNPDGNRMMFATAHIQAGTALPRTLVSRVELGNDLDNGSPIFILDYEEGGSEVEEGDTELGSASTSATFYTAKSIDETIKGFDIRTFVKFAEYRYLDGVGNEVIVPEEIVEDGSRVTMEITAYKSIQEEGEDTDPGFLVMGAGIERDYMLLKVKTAVTSDGYISEREFTIRIASILQWYPRTRHEVPSLTNDSIYLDAALNSFGFFGSSQIHDAVKRAAEQLVQYQTDDETYKDYRKLIVLITDGDENSSENSLNQAITAVNFVDGTDEVQIIPIQLGQPHASDTVLLEKYAEAGNSPLFYLDNSTDERITHVCETITDGNNLQINTRLIDGSIVFETPNIPDTTMITGVTVPTGSEVSYRLRTSLDGIYYSDFTEWIDYDDSFEHDISLESLQKYVQYQIRMIGNSDFETPVINGGVDVSYFKPREFLIFFQPVSVNLNDDEYISSIHITAESDIPKNSTVEYLMTQSDSLRPEEYYRVALDQHTILPTRFNEILTTTDFKTYTAVNGRWNINSDIKLWRIGENETEGEEIPASEYAANSAEGTVSFLSSQDPSTTIFFDVFFASSFRIATKVVNFAEDSAVIHHIGVMYNVSKRVPRASDGTIINVPISKRLPS